MESIRWEGAQLTLLDQRALPLEERWLAIRSAEEAARAIRSMVVRGAPAIAITAAYGLALTRLSGEDRETASQQLMEARPTAVNLRWALDRMSRIEDARLEEEACAIHAEDRALNHQLAEHGAPLLRGGVLTICNTGSLATGGHGTALGMARTAWARGSLERLYVPETRPYLQGARLTAYECLQDGLPCCLIADSMAGALMARGAIQAVVIGCDRVALSGDTANKIGSYSLAVMARHHDIPFYVAMPSSSLDRRCPSGDQIPIEERPADELRCLGGQRLAPPETPVWNPGFDVTPAELIEAWITEHGVWRPPFPAGLRP